MANYKERTNAALGVALRRQYETPLDVSTVFLCIEDLEAYVHRNKTYSNPKYTAEDNDFLQKINPYSYPGQIVAVINEEAKTATAYIISSCGIDGTYQEIGSGGISEDNIGLIQKVNVDPAITEKSHYAVYNNSEQKLKIILDGKYESLVREKDQIKIIKAEEIKEIENNVNVKLLTQENSEVSNLIISADDTFNLKVDDDGKITLDNRKYKLVNNAQAKKELIMLLTPEDAGTLIYQKDTNELWLFVSTEKQILLSDKVTVDDLLLHFNSDEFAKSDSGLISLSYDDSITDSGKNVVNSGIIYNYVEDRIDNTLGVINTELGKI